MANEGETALFRDSYFSFMKTWLFKNDVIRILGTWYKSHLIKFMIKEVSDPGMELK